MPENIAINELSVSILLSVALVCIELYCGTSVKRKLCGEILLMYSIGYEWIFKQKCHLLHAGFLCGLVFEPESVGMSHRNVGWVSKDYTAYIREGRTVEQFETWSAGRVG
jgi:hypothetical protein